MNEMKSIDDAVIELNGDFDNARACGGNRYDTLHYLGYSEDSSKHLYQCVPNKTYCGEFVCTREQFQSRAKELGFVGKYRWGVVYETDGKRPELEGDVVVSYELLSGTKLSTKMSGLNFSVNPLGFKDCTIVSFKITDQRYKPADTSYLDKADSSLDNGADWYCYDTQKALRLPPVDLICEAYSFKREKWVKAKVLNAETGRKEMAVVVLADDGHWSDLFWCCKFQPVDHATRKAKAERKRTLDAIYNKWNERGDITEVAEWIYESGFRLPD